MSETYNFLRPEQKHGETSAQREDAIDVRAFPLFQSVMTEIAIAKDYDDRAPMVLCGVSTYEYCIIPCPYSDNNPQVVKVIQRLRGDGWYADLFRMSESLSNPSKFRHAILVSWDPEVISKFYLPHYYRVKNAAKVPCGVCRKHDNKTVDNCEGCHTLKVWLAGVATMKEFGYPCNKCAAKCDRKDNFSTCTTCPAKSLYETLYDSDIVKDLAQALEGESSSAEDNDEAAPESGSIQDVSNKNDDASGEE